MLGWERKFWAQRHFISEIGKVCCSQNWLFTRWEIDLEVEWVVSSPACIYRYEVHWGSFSLLRLYHQRLWALQIPWGKAAHTSCDHSSDFISSGGCINHSWRLLFSTYSEMKASLLARFPWIPLPGRPLTLKLSGWTGLCTQTRLPLDMPCTVYLSP